MIYLDDSSSGARDERNCEFVIPRAGLEKLEINTSSYLARDSVYKQAAARRKSRLSCRRKAASHREVRESSLM